MTSIAPAGLNSVESDFAKISQTIVVCVPAFNEGRTIGSIVSRSKTYGTHVVVCDDGSTDDTSSQAESNGAIVVTHRTNLGKGAALKTLLREASRFHPDIVVTLDGDGQHDPEDIPLLLSPVLDGNADVVIGCRFWGGNRIPAYRKIGNSLLSFLTNMSAGTKIRDTQSGFRAYSSRVIPSISIAENGMGVDSEILIELAKKSFKIEERNVAVSYNGDTSTLNPASHVIRVVWSILVAKYRSLGVASLLGWAACFGTLAVMLGLVGLERFPVTWFGFGASTLSFVTGASLVFLGPRVKSSKWMKRTPRL